MKKTSNQGSKENLTKVATDDKKKSINDQLANSNGKKDNSGVGSKKNVPLVVNKNSLNNTKGKEENLKTQASGKNDTKSQSKDKTNNVINTKNLTDKKDNKTSS